MKRTFLVEIDGLDESSPVKTIENLIAKVLSDEDLSVTAKQVTEHRLKLKIADLRMQQEDEELKKKIKEKLSNRVVSSNSHAAKIHRVGKLTEVPVRFENGREDISERLLVTAETDVWDGLIEDFVTENRIYSFWGSQAVDAANTLEQDGFLYIKEMKEKTVYNPEDKSKTVFRSVTAFKNLIKSQFDEINKIVRETTMKSMG